MKPIKKSVLIVDDDPMLSKILGNRLTEEGLEVDYATNGKEALELGKKKSFSVILLDMIMPTMNGFDFLKEMRGISKKTPILPIYKTPIIVFSNLSDEKDIKEAMDLGAKMYLEKATTSLAQVAATIKKYL